MYSPLDHPLVENFRISCINGENIETINSWTFAALILNLICQPNPEPQYLTNAIAITKYCCLAANPRINSSELIKRCFQGEEAAIKQTHSLIANGLEALASKKNEPPPPPPPL